MTIKFFHLTSLSLMAFWISVVFCYHSTDRMLLLIYLIIIKTYKVIPGIKRPHFNDLFSFFNWETRNSSQLVDWTVIEEWKYGGHFFIFIVLIITIITNTSAVYNCSKIELTSISIKLNWLISYYNKTPVCPRPSNNTIAIYWALCR